MPIYEYACEHCGHHLDVMQKISDEPLKQCPNCQNETLQRLVSAASFRLKGGGWYETDFKNADKKKNLASSDSETSATGSKSEEAKSGASGTASSPETKNTSKSDPKSETKGDTSGSGSTTSTSSNTSSTSGSSNPNT